MSVRILIADDQGIFRLGLRSVLAAYENVEIVGEARNCDETLIFTLKLKPDVLLIDVNMLGLKNNQIVSRLQMGCPMTRVIIITACFDQFTVIEMIKAGVKGYILKNDDPAQLIWAILAVMDGKTWLSPAIAEMVVSCLSEGVSMSEFAILNNREIKILQLLQHGYHSSQIGEGLCISKRTVNYHIDKIFKKLGVNNRAEAVAKAIEQGFVKY